MATYWKDISYNGLNNTCQVINGTWRNNHLYLNGTNTWVKCTRRTPGLMTVESLFKLTTIKSEENNVVSNAQNGGFLFGTNAAGYYNFMVNVAGTYYSATGRKAIAEELVYLSGSYDGTTIKLYVNGVLEGQHQISGAITAPAADVPISIGSNPDASGIGIGIMNGEVYTVRLYDHALTQEEIINHYNLDKQRYDIN